MPKYTFGGQTYSVDHEPSMEEFKQMEQVISAQQQPQKPAVEEQTLGRAAGITARGLLNMAASPAMLVTGLANKTANAITGAVDGSQPFGNFAEDFNKKLTGLGLPEPQNWQEKGAVAVGKYAPAAALPLTMAGQMAGNAVISGAMGDGKTVSVGDMALGGVVGGIVPAMGSMATRMTKIPDYLSGSRAIGEAFDAARTGQTLPTANWLPDTNKLTANVLGNMALDPSGTLTAAQIAMASPKISGGVGYATGSAMRGIDSLLDGVSTMSKNMAFLGTKGASGSYNKNKNAFINGELERGASLNQHVNDYVDNLKSVADSGGFGKGLMDTYIGAQQQAKRGGRSPLNTLGDTYPSPALNKSILPPQNEPLNGIPVSPNAGTFRQGGGVGGWQAPKEVPNSPQEIQQQLTKLGVLRGEERAAVNRKEDLKQLTRDLLKDHPVNIQGTQDRFGQWVKAQQAQGVTNSGILSKVLQTRPNVTAAPSVGNTKRDVIAATSKTPIDKGILAEVDRQLDRFNK